MVGSGEPIHVRGRLHLHEILACSALRSNGHLSHPPAHKCERESSQRIASLENCAKMALRANKLWIIYIFLFFCSNND